MSFGDQVALFVVDVVRRVVEVVETVARAGFLHALAERVGFVADGRRAHALIGQAGETVAGVISERPVRPAVGLAREVAVGSVSILHAAKAADALQHVRGRVIGIASGARVVAAPVALREALAQAVAVRVVSECLRAVGADGAQETHVGVVSEGLVEVRQDSFSRNDSRLESFIPQAGI